MSNMISISPATRKKLKEDIPVPPVLKKNELDNSKEREKTMIIEIAGMDLEIPISLVQERMNRMYIDTMRENIGQIKRDGEAFYKCFKPGELETKEDFQQKFIDYLDGEIDIFRPF